MAGDSVYGNLGTTKACGRFSVRTTDAARCSKQVFLANGVEEDSEFGRLIRAHERGENVFVVREGSPGNLREALHFLLGVCTFAPIALWLDDEEVR